MYGSFFDGDGGFSWSCPAGNPQRGQSQVTGASRAASSAKLGRVSWPLAHQYDTQIRGAVSPRSASPIGPAPTRDPLIALPLAIAYRLRPCAR